MVEQRGRSENAGKPACHSAKIQVAIDQGQHGCVSCLSSVSAALRENRELLSKVRPGPQTQTLREAMKSRRIEVTEKLAKKHAPKSALEDPISQPLTAPHPIKENTSRSREG